MKNVIYFDFENGVQITEKEHAEDAKIAAFNRKSEKAAGIVEKVSVGMCALTCVVAVAIMILIAI